MLRRSMVIVAIGILLLAALAGCGSEASVSKGSNADATTAKALEPADIVFFNDAGIIDANFDKFFLPWLKEKLPNIHIQYLANKPGQTIQDLIAAGTVPDVLLFGPGKYLTYNTLNLLTDLNPYIKQDHMDLNRYEDGIFDYIRQISPNGETYALPFTLNGTVLFYNKDIFDKFSVPYPKDGMTWDELYDLAKKVTRVDGNIQYRGFDMNYNAVLRFNQLSLPLVNPKTDTATVNTDGWKRVFDNFKRLYDIPGNELTANTPAEQQAFTKDRNLAMRAGNIYINVMREISESDNPMRWDMTTLPVFKEAPGLGTSFNGHFLTISATGKHKEQAFAVIKEMASDDFQLKRSEETTEGLVLKSAEIKNAAGKGIPSFSNIHLQAITKLKMAKSAPTTLYDNDAYAVVQAKFKDYLLGKGDVNTLLREADAEINKKIQEEKAK